MGSRHILPLFKADWLGVLFIHCRIDPRLLQPLVPMELDTYQGEAYLSLVAFTQARLRPASCGAVGEWLSSPLACHEFLNLRTYVRRGGETGIFFLSEWIPNRLACLIGPITYGLPYRLGRLKFSCDRLRGRVGGNVRSGNSCLAFTGRFDPAARLSAALPGTLDHFLVERYAAYTARSGVHRLFRIEHARWPIVPVRVDLLDTSLLETAHPALAGSLAPCAAHYSPGLKDVLIGGPQKQTPRRKSDTLLPGSYHGEFADVQSPCRPGRGSTFRAGSGPV